MYLIALDHSSYMTVAVLEMYIFLTKGRKGHWMRGKCEQPMWLSQTQKAEKSKLQTVVLTDTVSRVITKATERSVWSGLFQVSCLLPPQTETYRHSCQTKIPLGLASTNPKEGEDIQADLYNSSPYGVSLPRTSTLKALDSHSPPTHTDGTVPGRPVYIWRVGSGWGEGQVLNVLEAHSRQHYSFSLSF